MTVAEITVASAILMIALVGFMATLTSLQNTTAYESGRTRALDDLRITAGVFSKDARHAIAVTSATSSQVVLRTYVNGTPTNVTYRVISVGGQRDLQRLQSSGPPRLFVIKLTDATIFEFDNPNPAGVRQIRLHMETKPSVKYPPVVLATEVALRNASAA